MKGILMSYNYFNSDWFKSVKPLNDEPIQCYKTILRFNEHSVELANVNKLVIRLNALNGNYGKCIYSIHFGCYISSSEMIQGLFSLPIPKKQFQLLKDNMPSLYDNQLQNTIKEEFNLNLDFDVERKEIYFELIDKHGNQVFDFLPIAKLVFEKIGMMNR